MRRLAAGMALITSGGAWRRSAVTPYPAFFIVLVEVFRSLGIIALGYGFAIAFPTSPIRFPRIVVPTGALAKRTSGGRVFAEGAPDGSLTIRHTQLGKTASR